jgi:hypothetical protein
VGLVWLCEGGLDDNLGDSMPFDKLIVWSWSGKFSLVKVCGVTLERRE